MTLISFGGSNFLRLASNLILTRLLFPEAFGLMALVQVFMSGLQMFSDLGIRASVIQSDRGDDPDFLNTAWTVQIVRGFVLFAASCLIAFPAASFYEEEMLLQLLPIVGLNSIIMGFSTTNSITANRHLMLGRLTVLELVSQATGIAVMITLAYFFPTVWVLVVGGLVGSLVKVVSYHFALPGITNRLRLDRSALHELIHFGKYIFLSTLAGFVATHGDRALLGKFVSLSELAVYNIAYFLGSVPYMLTRTVVDRVVFPLYKNKPPAESADNRRKIFRARFLLTGSMFLFCSIFVIGGDAIIQLLYDERYHLAGPILVLMSITFLPSIIVISYASVLLANGESRSFAVLVICGATIRITLIYFGLVHYGLVGVILATGLSSFVLYPLQVFLIYKHRGWDPLHDAVFLAVSIALSVLGVWYNQDAIMGLVQLSVV